MKQKPGAVPRRREEGGSATFTLEDKTFPSDGRLDGFQAYASRGTVGHSIGSISICRDKGEVAFDLTEAKVGELQVAIKRWLEEARS